MISEISDIKHAYYINLEHRKDRRDHLIKQMESLGLSDVTQRFNAIKMKNGAIGCSISHLKLLEMAITENLPHILIVEDDILFLDVELFKNQFKTALEEINKATATAEEKAKEDCWDVILFSGNNVGQYRKIMDSNKKGNVVAIQVSRCQTTTGYLVNGPYIPILAQNVRAGVKKLMAEPKNTREWAIDQYWFHLQMRMDSRWFLIMPASVIQQPGYSDIEERETNYSRVLLDVDKTWLKR